MTPTEYAEVNELLAEHSRLSNELGQIETQVNEASLNAVTPMLPEYSDKKSALANIEAKLLKLSKKYPELFGEKKSHKTPFGEVSFRATSWLEIEDEEALVQRIKIACVAEARLAEKAKELPRYTEASLLRTVQSPNVEALELLDDAELMAVFWIERKTEEKFSVKPLTVKADKLAKKANNKLKEAA